MKLVMIQLVYSKKEQHQTNKLDNFYSKKEINKLYTKTTKFLFEKKRKDYNY
jgi:hypothetical protein